MSEASANAKITKDHLETLIRDANVSLTSIPPQASNPIITAMNAAVKRMRQVADDQTPAEKGALLQKRCEAGEMLVTRAASGAPGWSTVAAKDGAVIEQWLTFREVNEAVALLNVEINKGSAGGKVLEETCQQLIRAIPNVPNNKPARPAAHAQDSRSRI